VRGGSWLLDDRDIFRCAYRAYSTPANRGDLDGFRVARTLTT